LFELQKKIMKLIPIFTLIVLLAACGESENTVKEKKGGKPVAKEKTGNKTDLQPGKSMFGIKAAKIVYDYTDGQETGTETLYFDDYGAVAVMVVNRKSKYSTVNLVNIWKDKKSTIINHESKTVAKSSFRPKATEPPALADTDEQTRKNIGYEKLADETIAGKPCEVWFNAKQDFKYCLWNKIALKEALGTSIVREATVAEEISEIPVALFEIPKEYKQ
jgi:hypothetical protein